MNAVDKARVARAFSRGAAAYDANAAVQRRAADQLLALASRGLAPPRRVLDVGAGTGALLIRLASLFPGAALAGVDLAAGMAEAARRRVSRAGLAVGDAEALPFRAGAFDLVVSSSTLQWLPRLEPALSEAGRVLAPNGTLALAFFGGATLQELRGAWQAALPPGASDRTHRFHGADEVAAAAAAAGLVPLSLTSERVVERHPDALALVRTLKRMGAGNAAPPQAAEGGQAGLGGRRVLEHMADLYRSRHGGSGGVPATWEILYLVARARG